MKRFLGFALAMFFAIVAIALVGGDSGAIAGHGCHGGRKCHGGLFARHHANKCHGGLLAKHRAKKAARCHGEEAGLRLGLRRGCLVRRLRQLRRRGRRLRGLLELRR